MGIGALSGYAEGYGGAGAFFGLDDKGAPYQARPLPHTDDAEFPGLGQVTGAARDIKALAVVIDNQGKSIGAEVQAHLDR